MVSQKEGFKSGTKFGEHRTKHLAAMVLSDGYYIQF